MIVKRFPKFIILIGPRATGKTTTGRLLAKRLSRSFADLDDLVRARYGGAPVREIWEQAGEEGWRNLEAKCLHRILTADGEYVLALGGGAPTVSAIKDSLQLARAEGLARVFYLSTPVSVLQNRLSVEEAQADRPSLTGKGVVEEVGEVLARRDAVYQMCSDAVIATFGLSAAEVCDRVLAVAQTELQQ